MKTYKKWQKSELHLDEYLGSTPSKIDEDLVDYIRDCTISYYCSSRFIQGGDPMAEEDGVFFYITLSLIEDTYWYLGILPELKQ